MNLKYQQCQLRCPEATCSLHLTEESMKSLPGLKPPWRDRSSVTGAEKPPTAPSHPSYHGWPHIPLCNRQEQSLKWKHNTYIKTAPPTVQQQQQNPAWVEIFHQEGNVKRESPLLL